MESLLPVSNGRGHLLPWEAHGLEERGWSPIEPTMREQTESLHLGVQEKQEVLPLLLGAWDLRRQMEEAGTLSLEESSSHGDVEPLIKLWRH